MGLTEKYGLQQYFPAMKELGLEIWASDGLPTESGPSTGALAVDTTNGKLYINTGTVASATWNAVGDIAAGEITIADGDYLVGNASGVGAAVTMSGDITQTNAGVTTIGAGKVTNSKVEDSDGTGSLELPKSAAVLYDFSVDGGTEGTIALTGAPTIPDNAAVWVEAYEVQTTCTSATDAATIALQLPTDGVLTTAIAISDASNPWDAGVVTGINGGLATPLPKKTTAARVPSLLTAGGEDLTAGKIVFYLRYFVTN